MKFANCEEKALQLLCKLCLFPEYGDNVHMSMLWFAWAQQTIIKSFLQLVTGFLLGGYTDSLNIGWQASIFLPFLLFRSTFSVLPLHYPSINLNIHPSLCFTLAMFLSHVSLPFSLLFLTPSQLTTFFITICPPRTSLTPHSPSCSFTHPIQPSIPPPTSPCPSSLAHAAAGSHHGSKPRRLPHT